MADLEHQGDLSDDFAAEVSDLRPGVDPPSKRPAPFLSAARRTSRQRATRLLVLVSAPLLVLLIVLGVNPALRAGLGSVLPGLAPAATSASITPGTNLFYVLPNPPGVDVLLDGHVLARPPAPGDQHPLQLAAGRHTFAWHSRILPFQSLQCHISVPRVVADDCPIVPTHLLPYQLASRPGAVIGVHESLSSLRRQSDVNQLEAAIQSALDAIRSTATVQPGEAYIASPTGQSPKIAKQPLRAVRSYQFVFDTGSPEPCILGQPAIPCRFPGQDCNSLCTVARPPNSVAVAAGTWVAAAMVSTAWTYSSSDGQTVASQVPESYGLQLAVLRISYDAGLWHVSAVLGHRPGLDATDDAACDPARYALSQTTSWTFMVTNPPPGAEVNFISGATPADGCVIALTYGGQPPALFLQRFGVLLTANDAAQNPIDNLPMADRSEQALAQGLFAQLSSKVVPGN